MDTIVLDYAQAPGEQNRRLIGWLEGAVLLGTGILLPMLCFAASINRYPGAPDFQRGNWSDYLTLIPGVQVSWPFAPLLFAASYALLVLVVAPERVVQSRVLRWALYSGVVLAGQYTVIQAIAIADPSAMLSLGTFGALIAAAIATMLALGGFWVVRRVPPIKTVYWLPCVIVLPVAAAVAWRITIPTILISAIVVAVVAPAITLAAYLRFSYIVWKLAREQRSANARVLIGVPLAWLAMYGTAWVIAFSSAIDFYNSLPKTPPDC